MICTPYLAFGNPDRSHGPVTSMPIRPELNRLAYSESLGSRYMDLSVTAMVRSVVSDCNPAGVSKAALVLDEFRMAPPASHSSASQCQTVSSLPGVTYAVPNCFLAGIVSFCASDSNWLQVQLAAGDWRPAWANSVLLYTTARLSTRAGMPTTSPFTVATSRSPTQKSFQFTPGCCTTLVRLTSCGIWAMLGAQEP